MAEARAFVAGNEEGLAVLEMAVKSMHRFAGYRERGKANCVRVVHEARMAMAEVGRRVRERFPMIQRLFIESGAAALPQRWSRPDAIRSLPVDRATS